MKEIQIHATNVNGLGAINVANAIISALDLCEDISIKNIYSSKDIIRDPKFRKLSIYNRFLPNKISRLIEVIFSRLFFENTPTLVLGDIPLRGIKNQVLYVHQANLIRPKINSFSSKSLKFKILRFLFSYNLKYVKSIIVQTEYMKDNLIQSYKNLNCSIMVLPLPPINIKQDSWENKITNTIKLIYPASFYPHKNHDFLFEIENLKGNFELWVTLDSKDFERYKHLKFLKNLGILTHNEIIEKYKEANALVNFSNLESFCLPLVEAIYLNLPILTLKRDYSSWMCESSAYYFEDAESFQKSLTQIQEDINNNTINSFDQPKKKFKFSWDEVGRKIVSCF